MTRRLPSILAVALALAACADRDPTSSSAAPRAPRHTSVSSFGVTLSVANSNPYTPQPIMTPPYYSYECPVTTQYTSTLSGVGSWVSGTVWTQPADDPFAPLVQTNLSVSDIQAVLGDSVRHGTVGGGLIVSPPGSAADFLVRLRLRWKTDAVRVDSATVSGLCDMQFGDPDGDPLEF